MPRDMLHDQRESLLSDGVPEPIAVRLKTKEWEVRECVRLCVRGRDLKCSVIHTSLFRAPPSPPLCAHHQLRLYVSTHHRRACYPLLLLATTGGARSLSCCCGDFSRESSFKVHSGRLFFLDFRVIPQSKLMHALTCVEHVQRHVVACAEHASSRAQGTPREPGKTPLADAKTRTRGKAPWQAHGRKEEGRLRNKMPRWDGTSRERARDNVIGNK